MWLQRGTEQTIVFIDPKGLEHTKRLDDEKIVFAGVGKKGDQADTITIKKIKQELKGKARLKSFILSSTPYNKLTRGMSSPPSEEEYINHHVLLLDNPDWLEKII